MKQHGPWQIVSSQNVYEDPWLKLIQDDVIRPDGQPGTYSVVHIKPGVSVLPVDENGDVYLTEEFHYAVGRVTIETVSGGIDSGESAETAARRELQEELGIVAEELQHLGTVDPFTSSLVSPTGLFLAQQLSFVQANPEGTEQIRCVKMSLDRAVEMVMQGEITHGPSAVLILKISHLLSD